MENRENKYKYWWECESCEAKASFLDTVGAQIATFIWDTLSKEWDQELLLRECPQCKERRLRIAFDFGRGDGKVFRVNHIVGTYSTESYVPMMKEFYEVGNPNLCKYDFTYLNGRNPTGLKSPAIVSAQELRDLFRLYCEKTNRNSFP
jgi:hypothetical protein